MTSKLNISPIWPAITSLILAGLFLAACSPKPTGALMPHDEPYRPQYHFTPPEQWMNDPNGMVYYDSEYHLFYQYHPDDTVWGPMHWGHAVSEDLVNWTHLPIALYPDEIGKIFSGSAVIDWNNTAGFGKEAMVAVFTHENNGRQMQSLAHSTDKGRTWAKYEGNPVLDPPNNIRNFRDPKVFWYENGEAGGHWVMVVAAGNVILIFTSPDLIDWNPVGGFGFGYGSTAGVWETPDLFELPVDDGPDTRWVLAVAVGNGAPAGGSGVQYFVGDFDGETFTSENPKETTLWGDYGADFYAPQSWSDAPDGRRIWLAWMNNWPYANAIPTSTWRGAMSIPREVGLTNTPDGVRLVQRPAPELEQLRGKQHKWRDEVIGSGNGLLVDMSGELLEIIAEFQVDDINAVDRLGLRVRTGDGEHTTIAYGVKSRSLFVDRSESGETDFSDHFSGIHTAPLTPIDGKIRLHLFVDRSSVEIFANNGLVNMTERMFPAAESLGVEVFADGGEAMLNSFNIYELNPATFIDSEAGIEAAHPLTIAKKTDESGNHPGHVEARNGGR